MHCADCLLILDADLLFADWGIHPAVSLLGSLVHLASFTGVSPRRRRCKYPWSKVSKLGSVCPGSCFAVFTVFISLFVCCCMCFQCQLCSCLYGYYTLFSQSLCLMSKGSKPACQTTANSLKCSLVFLSQSRILCRAPAFKISQDSL